MERFGRYVLLERIAHGGMAEVFRAATLGSDGFSKQVAIKRILPHLAMEKGFVGMLVDEAKIAATLNHPNILQVLDLGREGNVYFIAMEFVSGQALNHVVATGIRAQTRLPPAFCFHVVGQALRGLAYAHEKTDSTGQPMGIIHRDVSPQNVMVAYDGAVRLADFGIAKAAERSTQTLTGSLKGKPAYMAPEQVQGQEIDQRIDIYAMGVVLHEMLAMKRMRKASTDVAILLDVASGSYPKLETLGVDLPEPATRVLYRALEPDPGSRWSTALEFAEALEEAAEGLGWHCTTAQTAQMMAKLFPKEIVRERERTTHFQGVLTELVNADAEQVNIILTRETERQVGEDDGVLPTPSRPGTNATGNNVPTHRTPSVILSQAVVAPVAQPVLPPPADGGGGLKAAVAGLAVLVLLGLAGGGYMLTRGNGAASTATGQLIIETTPSGARVMVAGKAVTGVTPLVAEGLPPGPVEVVVNLPGMTTTKEVVVVQAGSAAKVHLLLTGREVRLPVSSNPDGATVTVNGAHVGETPLTVTLVGGQRVHVKLELPGHVPVDKEMGVDDAPATLHVALQKKDDRKDPQDTPTPTGGRKGKGRDKGNQAAPDDGDETMGRFTVQSRPWARIVIDGKDTERFTPVADMPLSAGKHTVKLVNDEENLGATFTVVIKPGQTVSVLKDLK
jgi:serine/threonine-protein kinase